MNGKILNDIGNGDSDMRNFSVLRTLIISACFFAMGINTSHARNLADVNYNLLGGDTVELVLSFDESGSEPNTFTTDNPARIAIDYANTSITLPERFMALDAGPVLNLRAVEAGTRTRVVIGLSHMVPYQIEQRGEQTILTINAVATRTNVDIPAPSSQAKNASPMEALARSGKEVYGIDFHRTPEGAGKISVSLDPGTVVDLQQAGDSLAIDFVGVEVAEELQRRLNVIDFSTPVLTVDTKASENGAKMVVTAKEPYEYLAYQLGNSYVLEVKEAEEEKPQGNEADGGYTGEKLSLNFQDIEVRAVLQLIADFTGLNVVASDAVNGTITLRLKNVPWDQALDIILKSKGLGMRKTGNVVLIAPNDELAEREKMELETKQQYTELAPLHTRYFEINYAKAGDISNLLKSDGNSLLSPRGSVSIDERTNILMVMDTDERLDDVVRVVEKLDIPIRQVMIESRIVIANDDFSKELGVRVGTNGYDFGPDQYNLTSGTVEGTSTMWDTYNTNADGTFTIDDPGQRLNVNMPVIGAAGSLAFAVLTDDFLVDLELSAAQNEGKGEVVSSPRVITANQREAVIEQGVEIPYQEASSSGSTSTSFKKAVLSLKVTPQITPDDRVIMDLAVSKDSVGDVVNNIPSINTRAVETQVLVDNGDTVVLGGIYEQTKSNTVRKVPLLGDIPILGALFRSSFEEDDKAELLIFVTPKIIKDSLQADL